jgi:Tfp pilus assembly protein PilW
MASQLLSKDRSKRNPKEGGFTLGELMLVSFISAFVFAGVLSAYVFLGRGLTRMGNEEILDSKSRLALYYFTQDVSSAACVDPNGMTSSLLKLCYPDTSDEVIYTFSSGAGTLTRTVTGTAPAHPTTVLFSGLASSSSMGNIGLSSFSFNYYDSSGETTTIALAVKQINMSFTGAAGLAVTGAKSHLSYVSPRVMMKSKLLVGAWGSGAYGNGNP